MNTQAYIFFAEGFEEIEAITIVDVLRRAQIETKMVSITDSLEVVGAHAIKILTDVTISNINCSDDSILILPGGMPGSLNLSKNKVLAELLLEHNKKNKLIAAICAAPFILGELDILQNKQATCYPGYENKLLGAETIQKSVVQNSNIITGNGPGAALRFSYSIVALFKGKEFANNMAKQMMTDITL